MRAACVRACVRASVRTCRFTLPNMNSCKTSRLIAIKFYLTHHWDGGKAPDRIRTLVSMTTESFHRLIIGELL